MSAVKCKTCGAVSDGSGAVLHCNHCYCNLAAERDALKSENERLKQEIAQCDSCTDEVNVANAEIERLKDEIDKLKAENERLKRELAIAIKVGPEEYDWDIIGRLDVLEAENERLQAENEDARGYARDMEQAIDFVQQYEREACAKVCDTLQKEELEFETPAPKFRQDYAHCYELCAAAIRARKDGAK